MGLFKCNHTWVIDQRSNVIQLDSMGYPLRLFLCRCPRCNMSDQQWIDVDEDELEELETGQSVLLKWQ